MGLRTVDHGAGASLCLRPREFSGFGPSNLHACRGRLPAREKDPVSGAQHARRFLELERFANTVAANRGHLHPQCELDRHGYDRHMAVRAAIGGPGGDTFPVDLFGHERQPQRQEVPRRAIERLGHVDEGPDRAEDASQSAEKRQGVSARLPLSGGAVVTFIGLAGYRVELQRIEQDIADLSIADDPFAPPIDPERLTQYIYRLYQRASIAGDLAQLVAVERVIESAVRLLTHPGDLYLLKANVAFKLHRLGDVEPALVGNRTHGRCMESCLLRADLDFQRGRYRDAEAGYTEAIEAERSWSGLARLAYFRGKMGDLQGADRLYREAEDELTAKEMRSYAWLEVQRGFLAFSRGAYPDARSNYDRAEGAYPGDWLVDEYQAELIGAEGRHAGAIQLFQLA